MSQYDDEEDDEEVDDEDDDDDEDDIELSDEDLDEIASQVFAQISTESINRQIDAIVLAQVQDGRFNWKRIAKKAAGVAAKQMMGAETSESVFSETEFFKLSKEKKEALLNKLR